MSIKFENEIVEIMLNYKKIFMQNEKDFKQVNFITLKHCKLITLVLEYPHSYFISRSDYMKKILQKAFVDTIPVMTGYICLGLGFGILHHSAGYGILTAFITSLTMFSGSMQYIGVGLLASGASYATVALTTLLVQARHLFYGISMLEKYKDVGFRKPYLIFALTDENYSLMCNDHSDIPLNKRKDYYLAVSLLDHFYWIFGCVLGATVSTLVNFNSEGIDFVLTALFVTIFLEQWHSTKRHTPALIGVGASVLCLVIFGSENFLIPAMAVIATSLCILPDENAQTQRRRR